MASVKVDIGWISVFFFLGQNFGVRSKIASVKVEIGKNSVFFLGQNFGVRSKIASVKVEIGKNSVCFFWVKISGLGRKSVWLVGYFDFTCIKVSLLSIFRG